MLCVIVHLVVPIPLIARVHAVEVARFADAILALPMMCLLRESNIVMECLFIHTHRPCCLLTHKVIGCLARAMPLSLLPWNI